MKTNKYIHTQHKTQQKQNEMKQIISTTKHDNKNNKIIHNKQNETNKQQIYKQQIKKTQQKQINIT